jgi:hypothetical protein
LDALFDHSGEIARYALRHCSRNMPPMSEWILLIYPVVLFTGLMLAARWQPRNTSKEFDELKPGGRNRQRPRH